MRQLPLAATLSVMGASGDLRSVDITPLLEGVRYRSTIPGGFASASLRLSTRLDEAGVEVQDFAAVTVWDTRTAKVLWQGRVDLSGNRVSYAGIGKEITALGPASRPDDVTKPWIFIDTTWQNWETSPSSPSIRTEVREDVFRSTFPQGTTISQFHNGALFYRVFQSSGQKLGRFDYTHDSYASDASYSNACQTRVGGVFDANPRDQNFGTGEGSDPQVAGTDFSAAADELVILSQRSAGGSETLAVTKWGSFATPVVMAQLHSSSGSLYAPSNSYLTSDQVVHHLLQELTTSVGDIFVADVVEAGTFQIKQLVYPDGATARRVLADLMTVEPTYYWAGWESINPSERWHTDVNTLLPYRFEWRQWPTTLRYEASIVDGWDHPSITSSVVKRVSARYRTPEGYARVATADNAALSGPVERSVMLDLGGQAGTAAAAQEAADAYIDQHSVPVAAATLKVARPIRDYDTGMVVSPWEIRPGHLVRLTDLHTTPTSLGTSGRDGGTVFQIKSVDFDSDSCSATLELDDNAPGLAATIRDLDQRSRFIRR